MLVTAADRGDGIYLAIDFQNHYFDPGYIENIVDEMSLCLESANSARLLC